MSISSRSTSFADGWTGGARDCYEDCGSLKTLAVIPPRVVVKGRIVFESTGAAVLSRFARTG